MEGEDKLKGLFNKIKANPEIGPDYKDATYEGFKDLITNNQDFRRDLHTDLTRFKLIDPTRKFEDFNKNLEQNYLLVPQPPAVSLAPPQRQSIEQQAAGQATGFVPPMAEQPEQPVFQPFVQFKNEAELQQTAKSPVFKDYSAASAVIADREKQYEDSDVKYLEGEDRMGPTGKFNIIQKFEGDNQGGTIAQFDTEGQMLANTDRRSAAPSGLIMPFKDAETDFAKMSPEQQAQAIAGSTGSELAESKKPKPTLLQQGKQAISDIASSFNRSVFKAPSAIAKTVSELGTGAYNLMGGDAKVEQDYLYQIADKYDKWIDDSEFAKQFIGDKNVNSLAGDVGSGLGQIATMITAGGGSVAQGLKSAPSLLRGVAEKFLTPASGVAFSQVFSSEYDNMKAKGESDNTALKQALANAFVSAPLESIPLINLTERMNAINPSLTRKVINTLAQGFDEMTQERLQQAFSNVTNNQLAQLESSIVKWSEGLDRSGEAGGLTGLIIGAIGQARIKRTKTPEVSGPSGQPPSQLGGIPTIPAPPNAPEFVPPVPPPSGADQTTYETVTPEELQAFQTDPNFATNNPERAAAIADDVALIQSGQMDINSIDDANYRLMVESVMGAGRQEQQGGAAELSQINDRILTIKAAAQEGRIEGDPAEYAALKKRKAELESQVKTEEPKIKPQEEKSTEWDSELESNDPKRINDWLLNNAEEGDRFLHDDGQYFVVTRTGTRKNGKKYVEMEIVDPESEGILDVHIIEETEAGSKESSKFSQSKTPSFKYAFTDKDGNRQIATAKYVGNQSNATPQSETIVANQAAQNMGTAVNQPLETGAAAVEVGESGRPVVEVEGDQVVEEEINAIADKLEAKQKLTPEEQEFFDANKKEIVTEIGRRVIAKMKPIAPKKVQEEEIDDGSFSVQKALDRYNEEEGYGIFQLVEEIEANSEDPVLLDAVRKYRQEEDYDFSVSGKADMDEAESDFVKAVEASRNNKQSPAQQITDLRAKEQAEGKAEAPKAGSVGVGGEVLKEPMSDNELQQLVGRDVFKQIQRSEDQLGEGVVDRNRMIETAKRIQKADKKDKLLPEHIFEALQYETGFPDNWQDLRNAIKKGGIDINSEAVQRQIEVGVDLPKDIVEEFKKSERYKKATPEFKKAVEQSLKEAPKAEGKTEGFTEGKDLTKIFAASKAKYGEKEGAKYNDAANRLVNPNTNTIIEVRSNGVVVKEGGKYLLKPFTNTDANYKKWELGKGLDVSEQFEKAEGGKTKDKEGVKAAPKTNKIGGYEFTATPSLTGEDGLKVDRLSKSEADQIAMQIFVSDANKSTQEGVTNEGGGWYSFDTDSFGGKTLYNKETGEAVALSHKKGGRMGAVINDFIANNSRTQEQEVSLLEPFRTKDKEGQQARAELKERVGPAEYKRLENIAKNGEKILKSLDGKIIKIDCP